MFWQMFISLYKNSLSGLLRQWSICTGQVNLLGTVFSIYTYICLTYIDIYVYVHIYIYLTPIKFPNSNDTRDRHIFVWL